jgi:hypothetical protein
LFIVNWGYTTIDPGYTGDFESERAGGICLVNILRFLSYRRWLLKTSIAYRCRVITKQSGELYSYENNTWWYCSKKKVFKCSASVKSVFGKIVADYGFYNHWRMISNVRSNQLLLSKRLDGETWRGVYIRLIFSSIKVWNRLIFWQMIVMCEI